MSAPRPHTPLVFILAAGLLAGCLSSRPRLAEPSGPEADPAATAPAPAAVTNAPAPAVAPAPPPPPPPQPGVPDPLRDAATRYMNALKIDTLLTGLVQNVVGAYRGNLPRVPPPFWDEFQAAVDLSWVRDRFREEVVKLYTLEQLTQICDFFESPAGQAFLTNEKLLQQVNSQHAGAFSRRINKELELRLRARKFIP